MKGVVVFDIEQPPANLRGKLQRFMLEIKSGVFVGNLPSKIIDNIWEQIKKTGCNAVCVLSEKNEQGYSVRCIGEKRRSPVDNHGLSFIMYHKSARKNTVDICSNSGDIAEESAPAHRGKKKSITGNSTH